MCLQKKTTLILTTAQRRGRDSNPRCRCLPTRRFSKPLPENSNDSENKDLEQAETGAYKPAYKENPKMAENQADSMPPDLAEIVQVWPGLPEHIKAAIKALAGLTDEQKGKQ